MLAMKVWLENDALKQGIVNCVSVWPDPSSGRASPYGKCMALGFLFDHRRPSLQAHSDNARQEARLNRQTYAIFNDLIGKMEGPGVNANVKAGHGFVFEQTDSSSSVDARCIRITGRGIALLEGGNEIFLTPPPRAANVSRDRAGLFPLAAVPGKTVITWGKIPACIDLSRGRRMMNNWRSLLIPFDFFTPSGLKKLLSCIDANGAEGSLLARAISDMLIYELIVFVRRHEMPRLNPKYIQQAKGRFVLAYQRGKMLRDAMGPPLYALPRRSHRPT